MGLFDFFKKKNQTSDDVNSKNETEEEIDLSTIKKDIETQRKGYVELGEICLSEKNHVAYFQFVGELEDHTDDENYMTTLNYVIDSLYQTGNYFIISLDWKQEVSSLTHGVNYNLKENFGQHLELPKQEDYGPRASVSYDNVFKDFDKVLRSIGFQLSFIDTNSDAYIVVVHKVADLEKAKSAILKIGYNCLNANSRKISG